MLSDRQEKILLSLIEEYINDPHPISSEFLKKESGLDVSPATIRNELQDLAERGFITQPHTSAGRVPTAKAYRFFVTRVFSQEQEEFPKFVVREIQEAKQKIADELHLAREFTKSLEGLSSALDFKGAEEEMLYDALRIIGLSGSTYKKNIDLINELINELENF